MPKVYLHRKILTKQPNIPKVNSAPSILKNSSNQEMSFFTYLEIIPKRIIIRSSSLSAISIFNTKQNIRFKFNFTNIRSSIILEFRMENFITVINRAADI